MCGEQAFVETVLPFADVFCDLEFGGEGFAGAGGEEDLVGALGACTGRDEELGDAAGIDDFACSDNDFA